MLGTKVATNPLTTDGLIEEIAEYVCHFKDYTPEAKETAQIALFDSLGCAIFSLSFPECVQRLGPFFKGSELKSGCRVPGTAFILDPVQGTFNIGTQIRWLDYNDTWLGREWAHPSDNFGELLAVGDWLCQTGQADVPVSKLLEGAIKAYEIQGVLALSNAFNRIGLDHVALIKIASAAVSAWLLGCSKSQIVSALTHAFCDVGPLRAYRQTPNTSPRKSWAAGDAASRGVILAELARRGETPLPTVLSAPKWGLNAVLFKDNPLHLTRKLGCYVMENILFKIAFPAEFHAQTAVEAAFKLHPEIKDKLGEIEQIDIETHDSAIRIIDKSGPLYNPADRDHCLQYMIACGLLFGHLKAEHYEIETASDSRIDSLREKMKVRENPQFSTDYLDPEKRSIASSLQITYKDGNTSPKITVEYPLGHKMRRQEGLPLIGQKFEQNIRSLPSLAPLVPDLMTLFHNPKQLENLSVSELVSHFIPINTNFG